MERSNWDQRNRYTDYRNQHDNEERRIRPSSYRGAYRLDTESKNRNKTTYDGFDRSHNYDERNAGRPADSFDSRRNSDFDRSATPRSNYQQGQQNTYQPQNYQDHSFRRDYENRATRNDEQFNDQRRFEDHDPYGLGNFSGNYRPDPYDGGGGENYGNMAGSLSYGYDGSGSYNPDEEHKYYNPMSGRHQSYHGNYTSRHPDFYDENDRRRHRDDFRSFDH